MYLTHRVLAPACLLRYTNTEFSLSLSLRSLRITQQCWVGFGLRSNRIFRDLWDPWQLHIFVIEYLFKIHIYTPLRSFCACLFLVAPRLHTSYSHLVDHRLIGLWFQFWRYDRRKVDVTATLCHRNWFCPPSCECAAPSPYLLTFNDP